MSLPGRLYYYSHERLLVGGRTCEQICTTSMVSLDRLGQVAIFANLADGQSGMEVAANFSLPQSRATRR